MLNRRHVEFNVSVSFLGILDKWLIFRENISIMNAATAFSDCEVFCFMCFARVTALVELPLYTHQSAVFGPTQWAHVLFFSFPACGQAAMSISASSLSSTLPGYRLSTWYTSLEVESSDPTVLVP